MRRTLMVFIFMMGIIPQICAQKYITLGMGYGTAFVGSDDLSRFKETYNWIFSQDLARPLEGFGGSMMFRGEIAYRVFGPWNKSFIFGWQSIKNRDVAKFLNYDLRQLELKMKGIFLECEVGRTFKKKYFANGVITLFLNRKVTLECQYSGYEALDLKYDFSGTYEGFVPVSADLGFVVGIIGDPLILSCKITYPLYTGGASVDLRDETAAARGKYVIFPDNYETYLSGTAYRGAKSNIDGLKILITASFILRKMR